MRGYWLADRFAEMFEPSARHCNPGRQTVVQQSGPSPASLPGVNERTGSGELLDMEVVNVCLRMIKTNGAFEPKLLGTARAPRDVHVVVERVPPPGMFVGVGVIRSLASIKLPQPTPMMLVLNIHYSRASDRPIVMASATGAHVSSPLTGKSG